MEENNDKALIAADSEEKGDPESVELEEEEEEETTVSSGHSTEEKSQLSPASLPMSPGLLDLRKVNLPSSADYHRKMSNDSGVSAVSSNAAYSDKESPPSSAHNPEDLIGEPRLASLQQFLAQQAVNPASLNPATMYLGLQPNNVLSAQSQLWANPLVGASLLHHQQEAARKALESAANGKPPVRAFKQYPKDVNGLPLASGFYSLPGFLPSANLPSAAIPDSNALAQSLKLHEQMINAYKAQLQQQVAEEPAIKVSRKSHSFSGGSSPGVLTSAGSPGAPLHRTSPNNGQGHFLAGSGDERTSSYQGEEDRQSVGSNKSSLNSFDIKSSNSISASTKSHEAQAHPAATATPSLNNGRQRKVGVVGSVDGFPALSDLNYITSSQSVTGSLSATPASKLSTASLPANLSTGRTQRKRPRTLAEDVKDDSYWERRRKNNEAAKRSRDSRRAKEDEVAFRASYFEQDNLRLRSEIKQLKSELEALRKREAVVESEPTPPTSPPSNEA